MSDWQAGGLALCVNAGPLRNEFGRVHDAPELVEGAVYRIVGIGAFDSLFVAGAVAWPNSVCGFNHHRFRKVRPDEHEACEEEFVTLLKRTKRTVPA